jgi:ubiquinone/menaquinone biosynthesis C-methylase UbiE
MKHEKYNPEEYWDEVARNISDRKEIKVIAGDDEPFYRYKREKLLALLDHMEVTGKKILEVGSGPGGNLKFLLAKNPSKLSGTDISESMVQLSKELIGTSEVEIKKTDGVVLPFDTKSYDVVFTVTVLQHNVDENKLKKIIIEICRVSKSDIYIYERIEKKIVGHESNTGRPVAYYSALFQEQGFELKRVQFLNIDLSFLVCGIIRKVFNKRSRKESEPNSKLSEFLQNFSLPFTKLLDKLFNSKRDVAMLHFKIKN